MKFLGSMKWHQVAISLLIGFTLGTAFGQWHFKDAYPRWEKAGLKQRMVERFSRELQLSPEQKKQVAAIFDAKRPQMLALHAEMQPKFEALRNSTQAEIRKILAPDQIKKFEAMNTRMEKRWKKREQFFSS